MKTQQDTKKSGNMQGQTTSDRAFNKQREDQKQQGISNAGGQQSFQTSSKDSMHKPGHKNHKK
ncbi:hypothetical protein HQ865_08800 [Mucilaginibacter mali]|uniref:Uncharacterized protein n=1 Tax=Mucilaginibacter mali TaxID=2740462 RepID=A0A7D4PTB9_9SPHI|nr:hypothetical protein [Mucilaginibacter mali]QKJ29848.1 hypothetical protein HQ865_08800 [Mucilaginibacter mali]